FVANTSQGSDTIKDATGKGTISFAGTTTGCALNLGLTAQQTVNSKLKLTLSSAAGIQNVTGGNGKDLLTGNALNNTLTGGPGKHTLSGAAGNDRLAGGTGNDTYAFKADTALGSDTIIDGGGTDTVTFAGTSANVSLNLGKTTAQPVNAKLSLTLASASAIE